MAESDLKPPAAEQNVPRFTDPLNVGAGRFSTLINIGHTAEFFALDFRAVTPEGEACLLGRFFVTPQHARRLAQALVDNLNGYEQMHGAAQAVGVAPVDEEGTN